MAASPDEVTSPLEYPSDTSSPPQSPDESSSPPPTSPSRSALSPSGRSQSAMSTSTTNNMTASSTPLGTLNAARNPRAQPVPLASSRGGMNPELAAKMRAFSLSRAQPPSRGGTPAGTPGVPNGASPTADVQPTGLGGIPAGFRLPPNLSRPPAQGNASSPAIPGRGPPAGKMSLAEKRGLKMPGGLPGEAPSPSPSTPGAPTGRRKPMMKLSDIGGGGGDGQGKELGTNGTAQPPQKQQSAMDKYADFIDTKTGALKFKGKAVVHGHGIEFTTGRSFSISLDEVDTLDELGKGNYGTVYKVRHSRPRFRIPNQGLAGNKARGPAEEWKEDLPSISQAATTGGPTGIVMAMKEMRLELDDAKFASIIMELDILHRCISPYIVDFYGAFFQEGAVYICMEFMDGGSIDKIYGDGIPEGVLRKITLSTVQGLKNLKEEHNIIHRDVKPTNILANTRGQVKICDFGVSGNLVASIAKTNIGCQSYMAPERISSGGMAQAGGPGAGTYSVQSDIWSLGLSIIECAMGRYPYPPETYDNIFSQLSAIVDGEPPDLPKEGYSDTARNFVQGCLNKIPKMRPTYPMLLQHPWLAPMLVPATITEVDEEAAEKAAEEGVDITGGTAEDAGFIDKEVGQWVIDALERKRAGKMASAQKPALHAAPLDAGAPINSPVKEVKGVAVDVA